MAAAVATIERMKQGDVIPHMWRLGQAFLDGLQQLIDDSGVDAHVVGVAPMPYLVFTYDDQSWVTDTNRFGKPILEAGSRSETAWRTFYTETTRGGVLLHPNHHWFVSAAHTEADLNYTLSVFADALAEVRKVV